MEVWVVISEWNLEDRDAYGSTVHGVFKSYEKAKEVFLDEAVKADDTMEPMDTNSEEDIYNYVIWEQGNYLGNHITIKIIKSEIKE